MVRVPDAEMALAGTQIVKDPKKRSKNSYRQRIPVKHEPAFPETPSDEPKTETPG